MSLITVSMLVSIWAGSAFAVTYCVSPTGSDSNSGTSWGTPLKTVQFAVNKTPLAGTVKVHQGTYLENVTLRDRVALLGGYLATKTGSKWTEKRDSKLYVSILDANYVGSVIVVPPGVTAATVIDGFTIQRGYGTEHPINSWYGYYGGGIYCDNSSPRITSNNIISNGHYSFLDGGGIYCGGGSALIRNNNISGNTSYSGGAISCWGGSFPQIINNTLQGNVASYRGGAIYGENTTPLIKGNRIIGNRGSGFEGGVGFIGAVPTIVNNLILDNWVDNYYGGGIGLYQCYNGLVANNVIAGNYSRDSGSGIVCGAPGSMEILNNTLHNNYGPGGNIHIRMPSGGSYSMKNNIVVSSGIGITVDSGGSVYIGNNDVYANSVDYIGVTVPPTDISGDPMFANAASGDFHILPGSPCINSGDTSAWTSTYLALAGKDMDGEARIQGGIVDIGADEFDVQPPVVVSTNPADGATKVLTSVTITVTFDEIPFEGPGISGITITPNGGTPIGYTCSFSGEVLSLKPSSALQRSKHYTVYLPAGVVQDAKGNSFASPYTFGFTTGTR